MSRRVRAWLCFMTGALFAAAMVLPFSQAIRGRPRFGTHPGSRFLGYGFRDLYAWERLLEPWDVDILVIRVSWLANPVLWFAVLALAINRLSLVGWLGVLIHQPGYWAWVLSAATPLVGWFCVRHRIPADLAADYGPVESQRSESRAQS